MQATISSLWPTSKNRCEYVEPVVVRSTSKQTDAHDVESNYNASWRTLFRGELAQGIGHESFEERTGREIQYGEVNVQCSQHNVFETGKV